MVRLRGQHELQRPRDAGQGTPGREFVRQVPGPRAWDLGANTGRYSRIAADGRQARPRVRHRSGGGRAQLPPDPDARSVATSCPSSSTSPIRARASAGRTRSGARSSSGPNPDAILALALVHHIAISRNVPLPMLLRPVRRARARGRSSSSCPRRTRWSAASWPPAGTSSRTTRSMASEAATSGRCDIAAEEAIEDSPRVLFLLRRR